MTADVHIHAVSMKKKLMGHRFLNWFKAASCNCRGGYVAENARDSALISKGEVPPTRTFFSCVSCSDYYQPAFAIQSASSVSDCTRLLTSPSSPSLIRERNAIGRECLLDPATGLGWEVISKVSPSSEEDKFLRPILFPDDLRLLWKTHLEKKKTGL
jgi:hypothetical protein